LGECFCWVCQVFFFWPLNLTSPLFHFMLSVFQFDAKIWIKRVRRKRWWKLEKRKKPQLFVQFSLQKGIKRADKTWILMLQYGVQFTALLWKNGHALLKFHDYLVHLVAKIYFFSFHHILESKNDAIKFKSSWLLAGNIKYNFGFLCIGETCNIKTMSINDHL
jgi:hypothetical protein